MAAALVLLLAGSSGAAAAVAVAAAEAPGLLVSDADYASGASGPGGGGGGGGASSELDDECEPDNIGFELLTGFTFTAPKKVIEQHMGTLMLTDCLEMCQANDSCQAVNFETGLCVLFTTNADSEPSKCNDNFSYFSPSLVYKQRNGSNYCI